MLNINKLSKISKDMGIDLVINENAGIHNRLNNSCISYDKLFEGFFESNLSKDFYLSNLFNLIKRKEISYKEVKSYSIDKNYHYEKGQTKKETNNYDEFANLGVAS